MAEHKCLPGVMAKCPYGDRPVCTYEDGSQCENDNLDYLPPDVVEELQAYRATGLTTEEIKEHEAAYIEIMTRTYGPLHQKISQWLKAEKDGRLVVLPCKVGDKVYQTDKINIYECGIKKIIFDTDGASFDEDAIGKYVFLTRREAEESFRKETTHG